MPSQDLESLHVVLHNGRFDQKVSVRPAATELKHSARREYDAEPSGDAERHECPNEKDTAWRLGDRRSEPVVSVDDGHRQRHEPAEEHDDVPRYPLGEQQRSARDEEQNGHGGEDDQGPARVEPEGNVAADVKWQ